MQSLDAFSVYSSKYVKRSGMLSSGLHWCIEGAEMNKTKGIILLLAVLLVLTFTGCTDKTYGKEDLDITVKAGETFIISLHENMTTGYQWSIDISDEGIVALEYDSYKSDSNAVGSGGKRSLTFKGITSGTATITLVYEQSWESNPDNETLVYTITVS
jgi:predicted secreted protein